MTTSHMQDFQLSQLVFEKVIENLKAPLLNADFVVEWVADNLSPGEVFSDTDLRDWALRNGFVEDK